MKAAFLLVALEVCLLTVSTAAATAIVDAGQDRLRTTVDAIRDQIAALSSPDPGRRAMAACYLSSMGRRAEEAVPALLRLLADGTPITPVNCWSDRSSPGLEAARALGSIGSVAAIEPLLEALRSPNPELRRSAASALGLLMRRYR